MKVVKRDGAVVRFDDRKIHDAIFKAYIETHDDMANEKLIWQITQAVVDKIGNRDKISVEEIQDIVELSLMEFGEFDTARAYILHRQKHKIRREAGTRLMDTYKEIFFTDAENADFKRENANINANASMGIMLKLGTEGAKYFVNNYVLPEKFVEADRENWIHYHDLDFSLITLNCCQIDLLKLFHGGFSTGHGFLREPNSIRSYAALACIAVQSNQNDCFGGQSINAFDFAMAEGVKKSFKKAILSETEKLIAFYPERFDFTTFDDVQAALDEANCGYGRKETIDALNSVLKDETLSRKVYWMACADVEEETKQAMEATIHNFNTLHCLPASEKIWVYDEHLHTLILKSMEELHQDFEKRRYKTISLDTKTGKSELKYITAIERKDNYRALVTIVDNAGQKVTTTDNHRVMFLDTNGKIQADYPEDITNVLSPRKLDCINVPSILPLTQFRSRKKQNYTSHVIHVTPDFAKIAGYYVADGSVTSGSQISFTVCDPAKEKELIRLMQSAYGADVTYRFYTYGKEKKPKDIRFNVGKVWADAFKFYFGGNAREKHIPIEILLSSNLDVRVNFLNGYFKCDGSIKPRYACASSVSRLLIKQIHLMFLSLNELSTLNERTTTTPYSTSHLHEISFCGNAGNRMGLEFDFETVRTEMRKYSYEFIKDQYYRGFEGRRPHTPLSKDMIDEAATHNDKLTCASNVFAVPIKNWIRSNSGDNYVYDLSVEDNETFLTEDCIFVHNSRAGAQVPFSSINYGLDTSPEGRLVIREVLNAIDAGLGNGETPIFPISVFQIKDGVNYNEGDPNYDLFKLACKVSAKRLYPNFLNVNASYNLPYYKEGNYNSVVATMGKCTLSPSV